MPQQHLDDADVDLVLQEMGGEAVPERVQRDPLVDPGGLRRIMADAPELAGGQGVDRVPPREQPAARAGFPPVGTQ